MDVFDAVRTLLAVRSYEDRRLPDEIVRRILEAGRLSASSMNAQPWHFVVVDDRGDLRRLAEASRTGPYIAGAPLAVIVCVDKASAFGVSDGSRAVQSMMLTAWAQGIASNWVGFIGGLEAVKPLFGIPKDVDVLAVIPFGYPAQKAGAGRKRRKQLTEIAQRGRWGTPFV
jgi:nitroreductase